MSKSFSALTQRVCGHKASFSFGSNRDMADKLYAAHTVCGACRTAIENLVAPVDKGFYKLALPTLVGIGKTASYANTIRIKVLRSVGPVMCKLKAIDEPYAEAALAVYEMLFKISSAAYWIECEKRKISGVQEHIFTADWVTREIEALMLGRPSSVVRQNIDSATLLMKRYNPDAVAVAQEVAQKAIALPAPAEMPVPGLVESAAISA